jgi:hypothetical protein
VPERADAIAEDLTAATDAALELGEGLDEDQWTRACGGDERTVAQVMHHIGDWLRTTVEWINFGVAGEPIEVTLEMQDAINAREVAALPEPEQEETLLFMRENRDEAVRRVRELSDADLDRTTRHVGAGRDMTVEDIARLGVHHVRRHLGDVKRTLEM